MTTRLEIRRIATLGGALALGLVLGAPATFAQQRPTNPPGHQGTDHGMMGQSGMADCPMMRAMMQGPDAALAQRQALELTAAQVSQLEALAARDKQSRADAMSGMRVVHARLDTLTGAERFDETAVRQAFDRMGALHTELGVGALRSQSAVRALLTPAQREKLANGKRGGGMHGMMGMGGMGGMMMPGCPMMTPGGSAGRAGSRRP